MIQQEYLNSKKKEVFGFYGIPLNKQDNYQVHNAFFWGRFYFCPLCVNILASNVIEA